MTNMVVFSEAAAAVLDVLYRSFPLPVLLKIRDLMPNDEEDRFTIYDATVKFLQLEGFLTCRQGKGGMFPECLLTLKGLAVLNAIPSELKETKTIGDRLGDCVKQGSSELVKILVQQAVVAMAFYVKNIPGG